MEDADMFEKDPLMIKMKQAQARENREGWNAFILLVIFCAAIKILVGF
jgi:hypothetical protein